MRARNSLRRTTHHLMTISHFNGAHPLLIVPNDEGCLVVVGDQQYQKTMSKKQMVQLASLLLTRASNRMSDAEEKDQKAASGPASGEA